jgi:hypothetical protein
MTTLLSRGCVTSCHLISPHLQEEEIRRAAEEKQRLEDEEAAKWMNMISVQDTVGVEGCGMAAAGLDVGQDLALCDKHTQVRVMIDVTPCGCPWP